MPEEWHEPNSVMRTHSSAVISEPHCYLTTSARCRWSNTHFCVWGKTYSKYAENIRRYCEKFSATWSVHPWPEVTRLHGSDVWAMGVTPYKTGRDNCYSGAWRHVTLLVTGILWWLLDVGEICGSPGEKLSDDDRSTELTITAERGRKNKTKEINYAARDCLVEDHNFIWQLSVGNSGRFVYRINPATNMSIGVGAVTKDVI